MKNLLTLSALSLALTGCAPTVYNRGHEVHADKLSLLKVHETTKEEVSEILGTPSSVAPFDNKTWYYISEQTEQVAFFSPTLIEGQIVTLRFDDGGRLANIDATMIGERYRVQKSKRETPTSGHSFGVLEQLFGNIGRFNGVDPDQDKPQ